MQTKIRSNCQTRQCWSNVKQDSVIALPVSHLKCFQKHILLYCLAEKCKSNLVCLYFEKMCSLVFMKGAFLTNADTCNDRRGAEEKLNISNLKSKKCRWTDTRSMIACKWLVKTQSPSADYFYGWYFPSCLPKAQQWWNSTGMANHLAVLVSLRTDACQVSSLLW